MINGTQIELLARATLEPFAEQGPDAKRFLDIFKHLVQDRRLVALFRRHYAQVKSLIVPPSIDYLDKNP